MTETERIKCYRFLDALRATGITNMWGAGKHIEARFKWDREKAGDALVSWIKDVKEGRYKIGSKGVMESSAE